MGHIENGDIKWAVVFDNYHKHGSIHIHIAVADRKYVTRRAIQAVFEYPFIQLGVKKLIGIVNSENAAAISFDLRLGFEIEAVIEDAYERGDMYILSMTPEQCRWIRGIANGNCERSTAAA
jgi:RimJ/RimL family protein N-acetyltransferase